MAYDKEIGRDNSNNCAIHMWPRTEGCSIRSVGRTSYAQCNNCLAMRITFKTSIKVEGNWVDVTDTQIVEPHF